MGLEFGASDIGAVALVVAFDHAKKKSRTEGLGPAPQLRHRDKAYFLVFLRICVRRFLKLLKCAFVDS